MTDRDIIWSERSLKEYQALVEYLFKEWGDKVVSEVVDKIENDVNRIKHSPEQFPIVLKSKNIRRCVTSPHTSIFFKSEKSSVMIISLFANKQHPKKRKLF